MTVTVGTGNIFMDATADAITDNVKASNVIIGGTGTGTVTFADQDGNTILLLSKANAGSIPLGPMSFPRGLTVTLPASVNVTLSGV